ncbi:hypothetical protein NYR54_17580 [Chelativorans sp. SCAU2101]|jgi:hypothetical protein|uniref:Uncharacterized protein n=1 Tax=Chelativorans petroleitrophicus TaxID=2975484 RepID=A0A9X3BAI1_9HYPH|nr:hypothetical protein [Chelativorans petroleitrophicus]MCT8992076.1 hypothetical protein [Chelativorans petroleitrophicus]
MNTANLQMEGVLMAVATLCRLLRQKGIADEAEIEAALAEAEEALANDALRPEQLSHANVEAALFPLRFLREANRRDLPEAHAAYTEIAATVGRTRRAAD